MNRCANCPHRPDRHRLGCQVRGCTCTGYEAVRRLGLPIPGELGVDWTTRYCPHPTMVLGETCPRCSRVVGSAADVAIGKGP